MGLEWWIRSGSEGRDFRDKSLEPMTRRWFLKKSLGLCLLGVWGWSASIRFPEWHEKKMVYWDGGNEVRVG